MAMKKESLGIRIRQARKAARINGEQVTQRDLAAYLGIESAAVSNWERGVSEPTRQHLLLISKFLDCSLLWLIGDVDSPAKSLEDQLYLVPMSDREFAAEQAKRLIERWIDKKD